MEATSGHPVTHSEVSDEGPSVLIVAEARMFAEAVTAVLQGHGMEVSSTAGEAEAVAAARAMRPDVVVVDLEMKGGRGVTTARQILEALPDVRLMGLAATGDDGDARQALMVGFHGCITKDVAAEALVVAIRAVADGQRVAPEWLVRRTTRSWISGHHEEFLIAQLTPRELEVIGMIAAAMGSEHIAERLSISVNTVRSHIQSIFAKLQVHSRLEAVACAARNGLLVRSVPVPEWVTDDEVMQPQEASGS
jgi:DNA-binding NarL/FixJ family response regulator